MESTQVSDWQDFESKLADLRSKFKASPYPLLFRGHNDSQYPLTTTLERAGLEGMSFLNYNRLICNRIKPAIETLTGVAWDVPDYDPGLEQLLTGNQELLSFHKFPHVALYRYMAYLRHHGFPSPLLDWTLSPYVAIFFAFREQMPGIRERSVFIYCEMPTGTKGGAVGAPTIHPIGPYVRTHKRHYQQQSNYTICGEWENGKGWTYSPHEKVFNSRPNQDILVKFDLPSSERNSFLRRLDQFNLNAFSLLGTEESLLEAVWIREHVLPLDPR